MCDCIERIKDELRKHYEKEGKKIDYFHDLSGEWEGHYKHIAKTGNIAEKVIKFTVQESYCSHCGVKK